MSDGARFPREDLFRIAVNASPNGMLMVDPAGKIVLMNQQIEVIFGYGSRELLGQSVDILLPASVRAGHERDRHAFFASPQVRRMGVGRDLHAVRKDGRRVPVEIGLNPIVRDEGTFVLASVIDITDRKKNEEELRRSNEELERFAYVASHDLQEPLRMVTSFVQLLRQRYAGRLDPEADEFIGFAVDGAGRMQRLIEDLLDYSRVTTRGGVPVPVDPRRAIDRAVANLQLTIAEAGAELAIEGAARVIADEGQLEHLFQNLIANAIKFRGDRPPALGISIVPRDREVEFVVRDNGIGIDPRYFERIFIIFQRLHARNEYAGTGIGLAICKKIVERHGGRIWVDSTPGQGAAFHFTFPGAEHSP